MLRLKGWYERMGETLNTVEEDSCCAKRLNKALGKGELEGKNAWTCPKCGVLWLARNVGPVLHWSPEMYFARF